MRLATLIGGIEMFGKSFGGRWVRYSFVIAAGALWDFNNYLLKSVNVVDAFS